MKIIANRSIQLDGDHVEEGVVTEVSDAAAEIAISRGWAVKAKGKKNETPPASSTDKSSPEALPAAEGGDSA